MRREAPAVEPPSPGWRRCRALVAYDGAAFHGFAQTPGVATVAGTLAESIGRIVGHEVALTCAGRTDRGVHGWGQVVSFDTRADIDPGRVLRSLNKMCAPSVVVRDFAFAADDFDARFSAKSRTYRYLVLNRSVPDPFLRHTSWHIADQLDVPAMNNAGRFLLGEHDFSSFCRKRLVYVDGQEVEASLVRNVHAIEWHAAGPDLLEFWVTARAFCHQMVRAITGTLVDVGLGKRLGGAMPLIVAAGDRSAAPRLAPPHGLTLWEVRY